MDLHLTDKVAVITGGGAGIGRATAGRLLREGAQVAITARRLEVLQRTADELMAEHGGTVLAVTCDTTDTAAVRSMAGTVAEAFGRIDILVNGAAAPAGLVRNDIDEADPDLLLHDLDTKVVGYFRCTQASVRHMTEGGAIVNIGGLTGRSSHALSGMRNLGIVHMTKALSDQLGPRGITVNTIHPGVVETEHIHELYEKEAARQGLSPAQVEQGFIDRTPMRRVLSTEEIADLICFLASPTASGITGESIGIDGGLTRGIFI